MNERYASVNAPDCRIHKAVTLDGFERVYRAPIDHCTGCRQPFNGTTRFMLGKRVVVDSYPGLVIYKGEYVPYCDGCVGAMACSVSWTGVSDVLWLQGIAPLSERLARVAHMLLTVRTTRTARTCADTAAARALWRLSAVLSAEASRCCHLFASLSAAILSTAACQWTTVLDSTGRVHRDFTGWTTHPFRVCPSSVLSIRHKTGVTE
jgi:hypothetical protein